MLEHNRFFLLTMAGTMNNGLQNALLTVMMFTVLREVVKRVLAFLHRGGWSVDYVSAAVALVLTVLLRLLDSEQGSQYWLLGLLELVSLGVFLVVLLRFGLFAAVVMYTTQALAMRTPLTLNSEALYAGPAWVMLGVIFTIAAIGFWMARKGEVGAT